MIFFREVAIAPEELPKYHALHCMIRVRALDKRRRLAAAVIT